MARKDNETPEIAASDVETPAGDVALEPGAEGADLASTARSPELEEPAPGEDGPVSEDTDVIAAEETAAEAAEPAEPKAKTYRPTEDYVEGDRVYHAVWDATGIVRHRDEREQIFRVSMGGVDEPGRCHLIRVEFEKDVPASGGARREVTLIADWRGRALEAGVSAPPATATETLLGFPRTEEERPAAPRARTPALPEIPEPEETVELEDTAEETEDEEEDVEQIGI